MPFGRNSYKKNTLPPKSIKRPKLKRQKRNGQQKKAAYEGVAKRLHRGFGR